MFPLNVKVDLMEQALAVSASALPACRPNPPVGCVIVDVDATIVARGFTGPPGTHHAEPAALAALPAHARQMNLAVFVTLEPCSFAGRTPSCALTLIKSGIRDVFVGTIDPDPRNAGRGIQLLRDAGVRVEVGIAEEKVLSFIQQYLWKPEAG